jgi:hypothetical protein
MVRTVLSFLPLLSLSLLLVLGILDRRRARLAEQVQKAVTRRQEFRLIFSR